MSHTALVIVFMLVCIGLGARGGARAARPWLAAALAGAMVAVQFLVLTVR